MNVFSFFSYNKRLDWEKGWWTSNLQVSDSGISLKNTSSNLGVENITKDLEDVVRGVYFSTSIDSTSKELRWHKFVLHSDIPSGTHIKVSYISSDRMEFILKSPQYDGDLYMDLDEFIKDTTIDSPKKLDYLNSLYSGWMESNDAEPCINAKDALFFNAKGRYLWMRIEFTGKPGSSPSLEKMRVYFPRMSYLDYLPAVYQKDEKSRDFLERFFSLFATFFSDKEEEISKISQYFDVDAVSGDFLKWLSKWMAIATDDSWEDAQLKLLIKKAPSIFRKRGTRQAIEEMVEIYTGRKPLIIEYFQLKNLEESPELKVIASKLYDMDPYSFCIIVEHDAVKTEQKRLAVQKILDGEKPAFTKARLIMLKPWAYMDRHTYLGVNTRLPEFEDLYLGHDSAILDYTVLKHDDHDEPETDE